MKLATETQIHNYYMSNLSDMQRALISTEIARLEIALNSPNPEHAQGFIETTLEHMRTWVS